MVKDDKHRTRGLLFKEEEIPIDIHSECFKYVTRIQDEVHRFAITFHRDRRSKHQTASELDNIKGIGEATKTVLLKHFKSVKRIKEASVNELAEIIGKKKAEIIINGIKGKNK